MGCVSTSIAENHESSSAYDMADEGSMDHDVPPHQSMSPSASHMADQQSLDQIAPPHQSMSPSTVHMAMADQGSVGQIAASHQSLSPSAGHMADQGSVGQIAASHQSMSPSASDTTGMGSMDHDTPPVSPHQSTSHSVDNIEEVDHQDVLPPPVQLHQSTSATKYRSLHREVLSPLAKGVQSVPIFARSPNQVKKFADAGFIKPHESKAELSLLNVMSGEQENAVEAIKKASSSRKDQTSKEMAVVQEASDTSSSTEEESIVAVHMQSLSLSALDQKTSSKTDEDPSNPTEVLGRSSTLSDSRLLVVEKKSQQHGKAQSKSRSFLKLSRTSFKVFALKSCITGGIDNDSSSDEGTSFRPTCNSSLDETANARSDREKMSKRKKKQRKKKKWKEERRKGTETGSETQEQDHQEKEQTSITSIPSVSPAVSKEKIGSKSLEWDHYGNRILSADTISDKSLIMEDLSKPPGKFQYHKDILAIFKQVGEEGGLKATVKVPAEIDEDKQGLHMTILHLHKMKEDVQKMLKVTQENLWESRAEVEHLQTQLGDMVLHYQDINMENMVMEKKLIRVESKLLQVRTELETKITVLEREIERLEKRLKEQDSDVPAATTTTTIETAVQTPSSPQQKPFKQNGIKAEMKVLKFQNSQLHEKISHLTEELERQNLVSQSVTQFTEYLKFKLLNLEEKLITEKQQTQQLAEMVSSTNSKSVIHNGPDTSTSICQAGAELNNIPEDDDPIVEIKSHMAWIQRIMEAVAIETQHLQDTIKINLEESNLEKSTLQAELDSLRSEQKKRVTQLMVSQDEVQSLQKLCEQLCEDNDRLEDICVQHAKEMCEEKDNIAKVAKDGQESQMNYGQLIIEHLYKEDDLKQQLVESQEEYSQAKKEITENIQQISTLQKKCSELISIEQRLRRELEHTKEDSQHTIQRLEENQTLAIMSLQQERSKQDSDRQEHEAELTEVKKALEQVCDSLKKTVQQNMELMKQHESLEREKKEKEDMLKEVEFTLSETRKQLEESRSSLQRSQEKGNELQRQYLVVENEKKQQSIQMQKEMDSLKAENQQHLSQLQHNRRLVEELQQMVKKQEQQHDEVLEELLQRNVEHECAVKQVHESTKCIKELQQQYALTNADKEHLRGGMEVQMQRLLSENQWVRAQLQDSQLLVKEQQSKCQKLSEDLKSATSELTKRDHTIESLHQELAVSMATQKKEFEMKFEENATARGDLEGRLCRSECSERELLASENNLKVQLAVQMETVRLLEEERSKNAGLEQKLQALENQLRENNKSIALSSSTSFHQASEIKMLREEVNGTKNQLKELIEDQTHTAFLSQLQEKQDLTNKLAEALSVIDNYDQHCKEDTEVKQALTLTNQNLKEQCESLNSLLEEEQQKHRNTASRLEEISVKLAEESREKLMLRQEKDKLLDWNQNIFNHAGNLTRSLTSISTGQNSELLQLKESSGRLASDIQLVLSLPSNDINSKENAGQIGNWTNPLSIFNSNIGYHRT